MKDVSSRLKLEEVADHPWIRAYADPEALSLMDAAQQDKSRASAGAGAAEAAGAAGAEAAAAGAAAAAAGSSE